MNREQAKAFAKEVVDDLFGRANLPVESLAEECHWRQDEDAWTTGCGQLFVLNDGTPADNHMRFCYHCGGKLK